MADSFGSSVWWGFTPAVDLYSTILNYTGTSLVEQQPTVENGGLGNGCIVGSIASGSPHKVINVLLLGSGDLRHLLKTLASVKARNEHVHLQFFIIEGHLECLARHMLFLYLLSRPKDQHGLREKSELFLELYGNSLIRSQTDGYIKHVANDLIKMVTDPDYSRTVLPFLDISLLKYRERDMLEGIFKFWKNPDEAVFDIKQLWDFRLRHHLGQRYDARAGVFDWDYNMKLVEIAPSIGGREYKEWRDSGVAFKLREDAPYQNSNKTLASGVVIKQSGMGVATRGYHGDIVTSPYVAFGVHCDNKEMVKKANGKFIKSCQDICEYNIQQLISLSVFGEVATPTQSNEVIVEEVNDENNEGAIHDRRGPLLDGSCQIHFLPMAFTNELPKKVKYRKFFDCVYFSNSMVHNLAVPGIEGILTDNSVIVCETARYMLDLKKEHMKQYMDKVQGMANSIGFRILPTHDLSPAEDHERDIAVFINRGHS